MLAEIKVKLTVFKAKLAYAGKFWMETRKRFLRAYGLPAYIVQITEIATWMCLFVAVQLLILSLWGLL